MRRHSFRTTLLMAPVGLLALAANALADDLPDIDYGMWETTSITSIQSEALTLPEQSRTVSDCVTEEDVKEGQAFMDDMENCEMLKEERTDSSAAYSMVCSQPEMGEMRMNVALDYNGDSMEGQIDGEIEGPMGVMTMTIKLSGKRTGDC